MTNYVPNNELDAVGGDPLRIGSIRTASRCGNPNCSIRKPLSYTPGDFDETDDSLAHAQRICEYAERLYQLGRGIDQSWATGEIIETQKFEEILIAYRGVVHRPTDGRQGHGPRLPPKGKPEKSERSLRNDEQAIQAQGEGRSVKLQFAQAPKPRFTPTAYDSPPNSRSLNSVLGQTRQIDSLATFADRQSWSRQSGIVLWQGSKRTPAQAAQIEKCLVGRKADGSDDVRKPPGSASCLCLRSVIFTRIKPFVVYWLKCPLGVRYALRMSSGHSQALN